MVTVTTWHLSFNSIAEHGDRLATLARGGCMCFMGDIVCAMSRVPPHVAEGIVLHVGYSGEVRKGDSHLFIYWFSYPYSFCSLSILDFFDCFFFKFCFPQQHNFDVVMQNTSAISFSFFLCTEDIWSTDMKRKGKLHYAYDGRNGCGRKRWSVVEQFFIEDFKGAIFTLKTVNYFSSLCLGAGVIASEF